MGSSQLPNGGLPFGYHHHNNTSNVSAEGLVRPPSPRNDPILGPSESDLLESFFDGIETNRYDCDNTSFGEGLHFSDQWLDQIAPSLLGHLTSYGTQPPPDFSSTAMAGFPPANYQDIFEPNMMPLPAPPPPPPPPIPRQPQPQSTLHHFPQHFSEPFQHQRSFAIPVEQNQHINVRPNLKPDEHAKVAAVLAGMPMHSGHQNAYAPHMSSLSRTSFSPVPNMQITRDHTKSISQSHPIPDHNHPVQPARSNEADTFFTDMYYGSQGSTSQRPAEQPELNFGSDALFTRNQGFVPPEHESSEALEKKRLDSIREALITNSVPDTRISSPIGYTGALAPVLHEHLNGNVEEEEEENTVTPRRGRRKSRVKMEGEDSGDNAVPVSSNPARKRKSKGDLNGSSKSASATPGKRRKSAPSQPKQPPRENLTDAQKRENHIRSEQKRRGAIREGFDDLQYIVPTLDRPGYSKSAMLYITADWLEALITDNKEMSSSNS
ncbi:hypothetical protein HD806DRAFT_522314 [Xylariaceae sp. AK1471]|nr:hypothetical protein HD806DRAFT_522314 [Xylariaceae sp. AK1471]